MIIHQKLHVEHINFIFTIKSFDIFVKFSNF